MITFFKHRSVKFRIILSLSLVLVCVFAIFGAFIYQQVKKANLERFDARLESHAEKIKEETEEQCLEKRFPNVNELRALKTEGLSDASIRLFDSTGLLILADTVLGNSPLKPWAEVSAKNYTLQDEQISGKLFRVLWTPIEAEDRNQYSVQIAAPLKDVESSLALLQFLLLFAIPVALVVSAGAVYAVVNRSFRPLSSMIKTAEKISAGNLGERLTIAESGDEVYALGSALNRMMERIESAFKRQKQFVADASHEIRTPLTIIRSELEFARGRISDVESKGSLDIALAEVDRLKRLSDDLLLLAKLDSVSIDGKMQIVRADELLVECVKAMKVPAESRGISLQLSIDEAVELEADGDRLRSALVNVIDNAVKFSPDGGTVTIHERLYDDRLEISVHNDGDGIAPDDLESIFERFHRGPSSRSRHDGSGLGLAIVRKIIEFHKGSVSVESEPGKGATFTIRLTRRLLK
jgi:heavy metal sensor kinase